MGKKSLRKMVGQMYNFYGLSDFLRMGIKFIGHKLLAKIFGFLKVAKFYSIEQVFRFYNIEVIKRNDINSTTFLQEMAGKLYAVRPGAFPKSGRSLISIPVGNDATVNTLAASCRWHSS